MADIMSYINTGWVKVMRSIINSRSYDVPNSLAVYCHCLLRANIKPGKVKGVYLKRGQFITGNDSFASECGLSSKQMRTALEMLEEDGLIMREPIISRANNGANNTANKSKKSGTLITVVNYDFEDIPVISGYINQGEQLGEQLVSDEGEQQGNSKRKRRKEEDKQGYKERSAVNAEHDPDSSVKNQTAVKLASEFAKRGFQYDGNGGGGFPGYVAHMIKLGYTEQDFLTAFNRLSSASDQVKIRSHVAYLDTILAAMYENGECENGFFL